MQMLRSLVRRRHDGDGLRRTQDSERTQDVDAWRATDDSHALKLSSSQLSKARQARGSDGPQASRVCVFQGVGPVEGKAGEADVYTCTTRQAQEWLSDCHPP